MTALINVPPSAQVGEIVEIKVMIQHPMETGFRSAAMGGLIPRDIISRLRCRYGGEVVLEVELHPAITANPFFAFHLQAGAASDELIFEWEDEQGQSWSQSATLNIG